MEPGANSNRPELLDSGIVDVHFGIEVRVVRPTNLYGCKIGDRSFIGPFCEIQKGVVIGSDCRIQSHSLICELVTMGEQCFIGHGVMFTNDRFSHGGPARGDRQKWQSTRLGSNVSIGSNATILPVVIADGVVVGAGAVVTKDLTTKGIYAGNPARLLKSL